MILTWRRKKVLGQYLFVVPLVVVLSFVTIYPILFSVKLSFSSWPLERMLQSPEWAGLVNFRRMLSDPDISRSIWFTFVFAVSSSVFSLLLGTGVALFLNTKFHGRAFTRGAILLPMVVAPVVAGAIWRYMFNMEFGFINYILSLFRIAPIGWLSEPSWAMFACIFTDVWLQLPFVSLILLAGLQSVPIQLYEAARLDGANRWKVFRLITLPMLRPTIGVAVVIQWTHAFRAFDQIFALTSGGPYRTTETLSLLSYTVAFEYFQLTYAAAITWVVFLVNLVVSILFIKILLLRNK